MNFIQDFKLTQYMLWLASGIVVSLATAIIFLYRDNKASQEKNAENLAKQNTLITEVITKNTEAFNKVEASNQRLADVVDRQERTTQNLEKLILQKLSV